MAGDPWPALDREMVAWAPKTTYSLPASERFAFGRYRAAISARIADIADVPLSAETRALATEASVEIARFDAEVGSDVAPFAAILLRSESVASSRIENLTASAMSIALAELGDTSRENAAVIVANTVAMEAAINLADRLDADAILAMHAALLGPSEPEHAGKWRDQPVWIGRSRFSPHDADFVPPQFERVPAAIDDLVVYMDRVDTPALIQAAIAHAQFETIHPFVDGNGRTGRALVHSLLRGKDLTRKVTVPVSAGLLADTRSYYDALDTYRTGDPEPIVRLMAHASFSAIGNGRHLVADLNAVRAGWETAIKARRDATAWRVADLLLRQPIVDSPMIQREFGVPSSGALDAINRLTAAGVLTRVSGKQRDRKFAAHEVLGALDAFADRSGRRGIR